MSRTEAVQIVCAADDTYAKCLAAMSASLIRNLGEGCHVALHVMDGGISAQNKEKLTRAWEGQPLDVNWVHPDVGHLHNLAVSDHINATTYFRLLAPDVLPQGISKVIYLDVDLLVEHDIGELWNTELGDAWCLAVQDHSTPFIDNRIGARDFERSHFFLACERGVVNFPELGLDGTAPYLNGGVMCLNLTEWRRQNLGQAMLRCLQENAAHVTWWDQYALNVVLHGHWKKLDPRWNQTSGVFAYPAPAASPYDDATFALARSDAYITHFASAVKPWHYGYRGAQREAFFRYLDMTPWCGWRPPFSLREWKRNTAFAIRDRRRLFNYQLKYGF